MQSASNFEIHQLKKALGTRDAAQTELLKQTESQSLVDATLTPQGIEQAKEVGENLSIKYPNIKYVFLSPMRRAVDTAVEVMKWYKGNNTPRFYLNPWLWEHPRALSDIPLHSYEHLGKYPFIDRSILAKNKKYWFVDYFFEDPSTSTKSLLLKATTSDSPLSDIADLLKKFGGTLEKPSQLIHRIEAALELVRTFVNDQAMKGVKVNDYEILLVGHGFYLDQMFGYEDISPNDTYTGQYFDDFNNGESKPFDLPL